MLIHQKRATATGSGAGSGSVSLAGSGSAGGAIKYGRAMPYTAQSPTNPQKTIKPTQIPSYQQQQQQSQYFMQSATQLPQTTTTTTTPTATTNCFGGSGSGRGNGSGNGNGNGNGSGSSSSASPLSPPSGVGDLNRLYRKSPFMQRKQSNGSHHLHYKYNDESPKKESMFSSIGQSILRNLTTSPFSQKKHNSTAATATTIPLPHNNQTLFTDAITSPNIAVAAPTTTPVTTPTWRLPADNSQAYDSCDSSSNATTTLNLALSSPSPSLPRKQFPTESPTLQLASQQQQLQQQQQQPQRLQPGNQSPIVLQRFYHQQNQLREKEAAERYQQQRQQTPVGVTSTNPFHSNYVPPPPSTHSTSSQSSTQSTCSQIAVNPASLSPSTGSGIGTIGGLGIGSGTGTGTGTGAGAETGTGTGSGAAGHFGAGGSGEQLQYQPLPIAAEATVTSPTLLPRSPEQPSDCGGTSSMVASKLSKLYARRQLLGQSSSSGASSSSLDGCSREQHDAGWFNTLAGAMKRQFATYVKTQLNSTATSPVAASMDRDRDRDRDQELVQHPQPPAYRSIVNNGSGGKSYYYRTLSAASSSSNTSQSTSPTTEPLPGGGTSSFLRRYANSGPGGMGSGGGGSISTPPSPHILAGLDRRHRSPDPPPRYNRGQSPLLLRKNLLELSGQPPGSPLLHRRYVSASPPLPPPRRGSESVPGSPQHFRTRIHYTPEPQRRIYRTIDQ